MAAYLSLAFAVLTAVIGYAAGQGGSKAILKRLEADFESLKQNIVYQKNCEIEMSSTKARITALEQSKVSVDCDITDMKSQDARMFEMIKGLVHSVDEVKTLIKNGR